ncbi:MAG: MotA/TolQ/ExbB proton channel family protein [Elusimicrobia bacterium]|nr:MotA/TolQ/ExbB proton channel family protein [Candidatus Obscuribacterium magneticum]
MDITTVAGIIFAGALVFGTVFMAEGLKGFAPFMNAEAFFIVIGLTVCALLVNYPAAQVFGLFRVLKKVMSSNVVDTQDIVTTFVKFAKKARTDGFLSLQDEVKSTKDDFLKRGVQLVIDGADKEFTQNMMETELGFVRERHKVGQEIFNSLGTYSPAFGIIGTILGMILMMSTLEDVAQVPRRMALALSAAFFGLGSGYLLFLPMAGKLRRRSEEELLVKEIIIRGVLLLQTGVAPSLMESNLKAYLDPSTRNLIRTGPRE